MPTLIAYGTLLAYSDGIRRNSGIFPYLSEYLSEDEYRELQIRLSQAPDLGDLMPGSVGFRKLRWADRRRGKGRRGGLRVIYYHFSGQDQIWLMTIYDKNEAADLTSDQKKALKAAIEIELKMRAARRKRSRGIQ